MDLDVLPPTITVERASELLGLSRRAAYRAANKGELPTIRFGHQLFVPTPKLLTVLAVGATSRPTRLRARRPPAGVIDDLEPVGPATQR